MYTPAQLCDRLLELGIGRSPRVLTDWRDKGLLPPLICVSAGRGRGVKRFCSEDVLDQAIAVDWLLKKYDSADEALLGLWLSGYAVDAATAQRAWIQNLNGVQHRRQQAAKRYSGGFTGLGQRWWRKMLASKVLNVPWWRDRPKSDLDLFADFLGDTQEWLRDDDWRDDEAYRNGVAELVIRLFGVDRSSVYCEIDRLWNKIDPVSIFAITPSIEFVESLTRQELDAAQKLLAQVAHMLCHALQLSGPTYCVPQVIAPLLLMRDFIGPLVVKIAIRTKRDAKHLPLEQTISTLHDFVMSVQYADIYRETDDIPVFSDRVRGEWESTEEYLFQLWIVALKNRKKNLPADRRGQPDRTIG